LSLPPFPWILRRSPDELANALRAYLPQRHFFRHPWTLPLALSRRAMAAFDDAQCVISLPFHRDISPLSALLNFFPAYFLLSPRSPARRTSKFLHQFLGFSVQLIKLRLASREPFPASQVLFFHPIPPFLLLDLDICPPLFRVSSFWNS